MPEKFALSPKQAWEAFEAQLDHTSEQIRHAKTSGYQDDSGDYLFAALELARDMQFVAMDGDDNAMVDHFFTLAKLEEDSIGELVPHLYSEYACDGIAREVIAIVEAITGIEF